MPLRTPETYSFLLLLAGGLSVLVMIIAWGRRHKNACAYPVAAFSLGTALWSLTYAVHWSRLSRPSEFFWVDMTYFGVVIVPTAFFAFVLCYTDRQAWLNRRSLLLLSVVPLLTLFFLWSDPWLGLFFAGKRQSATAVIYNGGVWFWFHLLYSYALVLAGIVFLVLAFRRQPRAYRRQIAMLVLSAFIPWVTNAFAILVFNPTPNLDLTPVAFSFTGVLIAVAIFRFRFLDIRPIAHSILFANLRDAVIVLDEQNRIVELNPTARRMIEPLMDDPIGKHLGKLKPLLPGVPAYLWDLKEGQAEINLPEMPQRYYEISITQLLHRGVEYRGRLITVRDITARKRVELQLLAAKQELEAHVENIESLQAKLREETIRDPLTGVFNRRYFQETMERELNRAQRIGHPLSLVLIDLDHFKQVNDTYGHAVGDEVLISLSDLLCDVTRIGDFICRIGGEEFIVILPGAPQQTAYRRANQWREAFAERGVPGNGEMVHCTFSAGVAGYPEDGEDTETILIAADRRMYLAKAMGRNRVCDRRSEGSRDVKD